MISPITMIAKVAFPPKKYLIASCFPIPKTRMPPGLPKGMGKFDFLLDFMAATQCVARERKIPL